MNLNEWFDEAEQPLDYISKDGGFAAIFRTIACIGDSLSSGEFESVDENGNRGWHDMFEYSWGQYMARALGSTVYNFSRGGMTAGEYVESFAEQSGFWDPAKASQAYILALGVNDIAGVMAGNIEFGSMDDVKDDYHQNAKTFTGYYATIVSRFKELQPDAKFFFVTIPQSEREGEHADWNNRHAAFLYELAEYFSNAYVIDLRRYAPEYDAAFRDKFFLSCHMNPSGYLLTAWMIQSYIDYIIRHNWEEFRKVGFIGTPFINTESNP